MKAMITQQKIYRMWALLGGLLAFTLLLPSFSLADPALRYQRASNRVERRDVRSSGRIENRQTRQGGRIENRQTRQSGRIENRQTRQGNRIERRDMLFSPPSGATAVSVNGVRCYQAGGVTYKPAFYEGQTVYVPAGAE
jgi:hypothetical protein